MVRLSEIQREYRAAGPLHRLIGLWGFIEDAFLTKSGHVGVVYQLRGVDDEGLTHPQRAALVHRYEAALRLLDERCRIYQYLVKRTIPPYAVPACARAVAAEAIARHATHLNARRTSLYAFELYVVLVYEPAVRSQTSTHLAGLWRRPGAALRAWLSSREVTTLLAQDLDRALITLDDKAHTLAVHLRDFAPRRLPKSEAFAFFRQLLNYDPVTCAAATLQYDTHVDYFVTDSAVECHRDHLLVGPRAVHVLTMKEPPSRTFAHVLKELEAIPSEAIVCLEWQRIPSESIRRDLQMRRRHFFNKRVSLVNYLSSETRPEEMLVDDSASALVRQLGDALTAVEVDGHFFGQCSLTVVLHHELREAVSRSTAEAVKAFAAHDGAVLGETYNLLNAWLSIVPGNAARNLRRLALLETNAADLSCLFVSDPGERVSRHLNQQALAFFDTPHHTTHAFNLHVHDVGHTLVLGATGSGKSFLLNFLVTHAQQYDPLTVILDLGHSYRKLATLLQGKYLELGLRRSNVTLNPFAFEPTPEHLHFAHAFVRLLLEGEDGYRLSDREDRELYDAVENVYVLERAQRRLFTLANLLPRALGGRLHRWIEGGRYAALFDNLDDTLTVERLQVFAFDELRNYPALLEPLLFYLLHRVTQRIRHDEAAATLKLCVLDEAWRFIQHPTLRAYVEEGLKTWRKHNAAMVLATPTIEGFASADLLRTVVETCPTKLLLANPAFDRHRYADLFQLNDAELDLVAGLLPRHQFMLKRPDLTKVLELRVDPKAYWIYTNTPMDNERVMTAMREHGLDAALDQLAASA